MAEESKLTQEPGKLSTKDISDSLLVEISWEVVNQVGGIYTVLRSKSPYSIANWGDNYCLLGPFVPEKRQLNLT